MSSTQSIQLFTKTALLAAAMLVSATVPASPSAGQESAAKPGTATNKQNQADHVFRQDSNDGIRKEPLRINPGDKRPTDQFKVDLFGHPLTIGGAYELEPRYVQDRRLDPHRDDDTANIYQDLKLELFYQWSKSLSYFVQSDLYYDPEVYTESGRKQYEAGIKLTQAWFFIHQLLDSDVSVQIGRQRMADKRQWWWNEELDAARIYFGQNNLFAELSVARDFGSKRSDRNFVDPLHDRVLRIFGDIIWEWKPKQNLSLFFLTQFDNSDNQDPGDLVRQDRKDASDGDLTWLGVRAMGKVKVPRVGKIGYWLDSACVFGTEYNLDFDDVNDNFSRVDSETQQNVLAWGLDVGLTWY
ncbi:MAG: alginate export family protein, partial [Methylococcales bacterium]